jgi:hypothetical protein
MTCVKGARGSVGRERVALGVSDIHLGGIRTAARLAIQGGTRLEGGRGAPFYVHTAPLWITPARRRDALAPRITTTTRTRTAPPLDAHHDVECLSRALLSGRSGHPLGAS